jgi:hypothetical protein
MLRVRKRTYVLAQAAAALYVTESSRLKEKRKMGTDKFSNLSLSQELRENNPDDFRNYLHMDNETFDHLLCLVKPHITKKVTVVKKSVPAEYSFDLIFHRYVADL